MATVHDYGYSNKVVWRCLEDQDPKIESGFCPKIMQICCKPGGLEDKKVPKLNQDFVPK
jgi:hypothetical protein